MRILNASPFPRSPTHEQLVILSSIFGADHVADRLVLLSFKGRDGEATAAFPFHGGDAYLKARNDIFDSAPANTRKESQQRRDWSSGGNHLCANALNNDALVCELCLESLKGMHRIKVCFQVFSDDVPAVYMYGVEYSRHKNLN